MVEKIKFKKGDRVRFNSPGRTNLHNKIGTVMEDNSTQPWIDFDEYVATNHKDDLGRHGYRHCCMQYELELVEEVKEKIEKVLPPGVRVKVDGYGDNLGRIIGKSCIGVDELQSYNFVPSRNFWSQSLAYKDVNSSCGVSIGFSAGIKNETADIIKEPKETKTNKKTIMNKISTFVKRLIDPDTQALIEAGFISQENMQPTREGLEVLTETLFFANKAELVKLAKAKLAEEKGDKKATK